MPTMYIAKATTACQTSRQPVCALGSWVSSTLSRLSSLDRPFGAYAICIPGRLIAKGPNDLST